MSPRPNRKTIRRRRRAFFAVAGGLLLIVLFLALRPLLSGTPDWTGTWAGSDALLGTTRWHISADPADAGRYTVKGLRVAGQPVADFHLDDGNLFASGSSANGAWKVELQMASDGQQLVATYWAAGGAPAQHIRFTRWPAR
jgi:hypothetical protein